MQVLIVDDDDFAIKVLEKTLSRMGYTAVAAHNGREALDILLRGEVRLVITDWDMPEMTGVELCRAVRREDLSGYVYIIMLTGREGAKQRLEGLCAGADDFLNKPLDPEELLVCLKTAERILSLETRDLALFAMAKLAESRDSETGAHVERVQSYTRLIAQLLSEEMKTNYGVDDEYVRLLYQTSPLHDLGKVGIPDAILLKPGKLTPDEFAIMKTHTIVGAKTLDAALQRFPNARFLQIAREIAATHHEKFDGSGYPQGLVGRQIPLCGRIVAVADVYDALTSRRVYKQASSHEEAKAILLRDRGSHFDPEVVEAFLRAEEKILAVKERLSDEVPSSSKPIDTPAPPQPDLGGPIPCKILVVEDDPVLLAKLTRLLVATGEQVFPARDGEEATKILEEQSPRIVVSDWVMPGVDGVELCRRVRARGDADRVHFIMLTIHSDKARLLDAYQAGVDDFVAKPFDQEELLARVRAGIRAAKLRDELIRKASGSQALNSQLAILNSRLERLSITDELTGLFNRRHAMIRLEEQWAMAERHGTPLSIAMIDIDHFKRINDTYGHDAGDVVLRQVAGVLRDQTRAVDAVCRVGGEEFLIIFASQTIQEAGVCVERCRATIEAQTFSVRGTTINATISIGLTTRTREMGQHTTLLRVADQMLYEAKKAGRNVVRVDDQVRPQNEPDSAAVAPVETPATPQAPPETSERVPLELAPPPINMDAVLKRCGGDLKFVEAVTERFRTQAGEVLAKVEQALARGDADALRLTAHSLKSMAAFMSADTAANLANQIETLGRSNQLAEVAPLLVELREDIEQVTNWIAHKDLAHEAARRT